jgi:hypothetical protein
VFNPVFNPVFNVDSPSKDGGERRKVSQWAQLFGKICGHSFAEGDFTTIESCSCTIERTITGLLSDAYLR